MNTQKRPDLAPSLQTASVSWYTDDDLQQAYEQGFQDGQQALLDAARRTEAEIDDLKDKT